MKAIKTVELTKRYKDITALDRVNLEIAEGELFSLLGINGAGKTTMIKILTCLALPTDGDAFIKDKSVKDHVADIKRFIGVSPQESAVAPNLTVKENLELIAGIHGFSKQESEQKICDVSNKLGLESILGRKASKLSGGFQRRLSIAMALISDPEVLFLDEPTLGLDVIARRELWDLIKGMKKKSTIVLTTHYMEEAEALSDRIGIMKDGRLLAVGTVDELKRISGASDFESAFISIVKGDVI